MDTHEAREAAKMFYDGGWRATEEDRIDFFMQGHLVCEHESEIKEVWNALVRFCEEVRE